MTKLEMEKRIRDLEALVRGLELQIRLLDMKGTHIPYVAPQWLDANDIVRKVPSQWPFPTT